MNLAKVKIADRIIGNILLMVLSTCVFIKRVICPKPQFDSKDVKKILFIKFWGIGNMVLLMPIFKRVKDVFKDAEIDLLTLSSNKDIMETFPHLDSLYLIDASNLYRFLISTLKILRVIRKKRFDLLIDFEIYGNISTIFSFFSSSRFKISISPKGYVRGLFYDTKLLYNKNGHITEAYRDLVKKIGVQSFEIEPIRIITTRSDEELVGKLLRKFHIEKHGISVGMHIGSGDNFQGRRWANVNFVQLSNMLIKEYNCKIFFTGTNQEKGMTEEAVKMLNKNKNVIDIAGQLSTRQLAYMAGIMNLFISNDTGPLHIAACMETPVVGLYGPNTPLIYSPLGKKVVVIYKNLKCSPCITNNNSKSSSCRKFKCMQYITVEEVMDIARECLRPAVFKQIK